MDPNQIVCMVCGQHKDAASAKPTFNGFQCADCTARADAHHRPARRRSRQAAIAEISFGALVILAATAAVIAGYAGRSGFAVVGMFLAGVLIGAKGLDGLSKTRR